MSMPSSQTVVVSSDHDGQAIQSRIYRPVQTGNLSYAKAAVIAHPYGPLGGSYDDHVVLALTDTLAQNGYTVLTFNSRKRPSWTLKPEIDDYATLAKHVCRTAVEGLHPDDSSEIARHVDFLAVGYSYGAFVASHVPALHDLDDNKQDINGESQTMAKSQPVQITTRYLLIARPLALVEFTLAPFLSSQTKTASTSTLATHDAYAVFASEDEFTSSQRQTAWARETGVKHAVVQGANHFWSRDGCLEDMLRLVRDWIVSVKRIARGGGSGQ